MAHEIDRVMRAFASEPWLIDPRKAEQIVAMLELRAARGPRAEPFRSDDPSSAPVSESAGRVAVLRLYGAIAPRAAAVRDVSQSAALMTDFQAAFRRAANDPDVTAIVIDVDSPGGNVALVPETASMIFNARREGRPIIAVANTLAASAAYWIASAADELVVTPSGEVGSIGVYTVHQDVSDALATEGVKMTFIAAGPRKVEGNPFEPLDDVARNALMARVRTSYDQFTADVAKFRGVPVKTVRADPEDGDAHFGGGRVYGAKEAVKLGMADRVDTLDATIERLTARPRRRTATARRRAALL